MLTSKQFATFTRTLRAEMRPAYVCYIPQNDLGIRSGYYREGAIASLLREHPGKARAILHLARNVGQE